MADSIRVAYADPPYPGCAHLYPEKTEVDHAALIARLCDEFPDGWALSTHSPGLKLVLPLCPEGTRVMAWVKPYSPSRPGVMPIYAWEPLLVRGGRSGRANVGDHVRDWVMTNPNWGRTRGELIGKKPDDFCWWLFRVLGLRKGDELVDIFPGSGAVGRAWDRWSSSLVMGQGTLDSENAALFVSGAVR